MQLVKVENLSEYYDYCRNVSKIKGAFVITKNNYLFYAKISANDDCSHTDICRTIEKELNVDNREGNIYGYTEYDCFCIDFISTPNITAYQKKLIFQLFNEICSIEDNIQVSIYSENKYKEFNNETFKKIKRYLESNIKIKEKVKCK